MLVQHASSPAARAASQQHLRHARVQLQPNAGLLHGALLTRRTQKVKWTCHAIPDDTAKITPPSSPDAEYDAQADAQAETLTDLESMQPTPRDDDVCDLAHPPRS